jgi:hypothetical protein
MHGGSQKPPRLSMPKRILSYLANNLFYLILWMSILLGTIPAALHAET